MPDPAYVLGHSTSEVHRLDLLGTVLNPGTERILRAAGLGSGMSVLDIGTGAGSVAMLAADLVGPAGSVLGIDREASVLDHARVRADEAGVDNLRYEAATLDTLPADRTFDAVIGRYVLHHQADRVAFLKSAARRCRSGGILVFVEPNLLEVDPPRIETGYRWSNPTVPLFDRAADLCMAALKRAGATVATGGEFVRLFHDAGLPEPQLRQDGPLASANSAIVEWLFLSLHSLLPALEEHGITTAAELGIETLQARMQEAVSAAHSQIRFADLVGAWTQIA